MKDMNILFSTVGMENGNTHPFWNFPNCVCTKSVSLKKDVCYQQTMSSDYILNLMENKAFPDLP